MRVWTCVKRFQFTRYNMERITRSIETPMHMLSINTCFYIQFLSCFTDLSHHTVMILLYTRSLVALYKFNEIAYVVFFFLFFLKKVTLCWLSC